MACVRGNGTCSVFIFNFFLVNAKIYFHLFHRYYPHHYAPYVSDIRNFAHLELKYDLGKPFLPYEQLLGVLPAASKALLPVAHHSLMSSVDSPIIDYYPSNFQVSFTFFSF